jgi:hypothetical protein
MYVTRMAVFYRAASCDTERRILVPLRRARRARVNRASLMGMSGAGLTTSMRGQARPDRPALKPYRGNPPYGILGGTMETSASFEARSAPSSYPTQDSAARLTDGTLRPVNKGPAKGTCAVPCAAPCVSLSRTVTRHKQSPRAMIRWVKTAVRLYARDSETAHPYEIRSSADRVLARRANANAHDTLHLGTRRRARDPRGQRRSQQ